MPLDDVLDHFDWEDDPDEAEYTAKNDLVGFDPHVETIRIKRFAFTWQAELAALALRRHEIQYFLTNSLTSNMLQLEWTPVDLYVRKEDAKQALDVLEEVDA